ncbi:MAG: putative cytosine-specific methyltransferase [Prokaryotic dsDNA virus sp.]|nr:MAG: putative cytosine-specific methyltransferase [Prokaryotic dsDNA virus sp.]|tara:strand:+ start:23881 stop:24843 length:963 start_codon:yes stop_codon:yes gene_type:complete
MLKIAGDCSGLGAFEVALNRLGIKYTLEFASELNKYARTGYLSLHKPKTMYEDINQRDNTKYLKPLDLYFCGFPCQPFSSSRSRLGLNDSRGTIFYKCLEFIKANQPKIVVFENVRGLTNIDNGKTYNNILNSLAGVNGSINGQISLDDIEGLGYHVYHKILNSKDYNVAQNRERVFIVCFKYWRAFNFPKKIYRTKTLEDSLEKIVDDKYNVSKSTLEFFAKHRKTRGKKTDLYIDEDIAHTISARYHKQGAEDTYVRNHKGNPRRLTPLECFRLQGFSDEEYNKVRASGLSETRQYSLAGNSITVDVLVEIFKKIYLK